MEQRFDIGKFVRTLAVWAAIGAAAIFFGTEILLVAKLTLGALAISFLLDPACTFLARRIKRSRAALVSLLGGLLAFIALAMLLLPALTGQFAELVASLPVAVEHANRLISQTNSFLAERGFGQIALENIRWESLSSVLAGLLSGTGRMFGSLAGGLSSAVMACFLAYYFLAEKSALLLKTEMLVPAKSRKTLARIFLSIRDELRAYLRSQLLVAACVAALGAIAFSLIGLQGAPALGLLMGAANCIPYFGPFLGGAPAVICALTNGLPSALLTLLSILAVQQIDNLFITPRITGGATGLTPPVVMLSVLAGGSAFGWIGMLLAIPTVLCVRCAARILFTAHLHSR